MARKRKQHVTYVKPHEPYAWAHLGAWRDFAELTQEQVAETFSVSSVTIHRWETGKAPITVENLMMLAKIYGAHSIAELTLAPTHRRLAADAMESMRLIGVLADGKRKTWIEVGRAMAEDTHQD